MQNPQSFFYRFLSSRKRHFSFFIIIVTKVSAEMAQSRGENRQSISEIGGIKIKTCLQFISPNCCSTFHLNTSNLSSQSSVHPTSCKLLQLARKTLFFSLPHYRAATTTAAAIWSIRLGPLRKPPNSSLAQATPSYCFLSRFSHQSQDEPIQFLLIAGRQFVHTACCS